MGEDFNQDENESSLRIFACDKVIFFPYLAQNK